MTTEQREEFWRRFYSEIERFRESGANCEIATNLFEVRRWNAKFTMRRAGRPLASVTLAIGEHAPSAGEMLLSVTPTYAVEDVVTDGERLLIPVFFDPAVGTFLLHAEHGPVEEARMAEFFARLAGAMLGRL